MALLIGSALVLSCAHAQSSAVKRSFLNVRSGDDSVFWSNRSLLTPYASLTQDLKLPFAQCGLQKEAQDFYIPQVPEALQFHRYGSLLSFILRRSVQNMDAIPVVLAKGNLKDRSCVYKTSKKITNVNKQESAPSSALIVQESGNEDVLSQGLYSGAVRLIPNNGTQYDPSPLALGLFPAFFNLNYDDPALDKYSNRAHLFAKSANCGLHARVQSNISSKCEFTFKGPEVKAYFARQKGLGELTGTFDQDGNVSFNIPYALTSHEDYINTGFYSETELLVLKDLGFDVRPREFIGTELISRGSPDQRVKNNFNSGFYAYSERTSTYDISHPASLPLTTGLHIGGKFNEVSQSSSIVAIGAGSVGVRIDGTDNSYTLDQDSSIIENGYDSAGIAVTYGSGHELDIRGRVYAGGAGGVGIALAFPSNLRSNLVEYRGSYFRVRPLDEQKGQEEERKQEIERNSLRDLPQELNGPLTKELRISGHIYGNKAGIFIGQDAHAAKISLLNGAHIEGGINSQWEPFFEEGHIKIAPKDGKYKQNVTLHLEKYLRNTDELDGFTADGFIKDRLHTSIVTGELKTDNGLVTNNPNSDVHISGGIEGKTLDLISRGGHTRVVGSLNIGALEVSDSVVSLSGGEQKSQVQHLRMQGKGVLNLVNGKKDIFAVKLGGYIDAGASLRLDVNADGTPSDELTFVPLISSPGGYINVEPGLSYTQVRSLNASPREFMRFIDNFTQGARLLYKDSGLNVSFPRHVWYANGELGMELKCSSHGCRAGRFLSSVSEHDQDIPLWRYCLSGAGSTLLFFILFMYFSYEKHNGREKRELMQAKNHMNNDNAK